MTTEAMLAEDGLNIAAKINGLGVLGRKLTVRPDPKDHAEMQFTHGASASDFAEKDETLAYSTTMLGSPRSVIPFKRG